MRKSRLSYPKVNRSIVIMEGSLESMDAACIPDHLHSHLLPGFDAQLTETTYSTILTQKTILDGPSLWIHDIYTQQDTELSLFAAKPAYALQVTSSNSYKKAYLHFVKAGQFYPYYLSADKYTRIVHINFTAEWLRQQSEKQLLLTTLLYKAGLVQTTGGSLPFILNQEAISFIEGLTGFRDRHPSEKDLRTFYSLMLLQELCRQLPERN